MAVVYRATQLVLARRVALKLIAPEHARDAAFRERFLRESKLAASVEHPHVIPVYEAGDDDGVLFIAMRYVDGVDLGALLGGLGPLAAPDAVRIISQVAGALDAAHAVGLIHRDVKPANILVTEDLEHAFLTDFGIARALDGTSSLTAAGLFIGTPDYAAPEQLAGEPVDRCVDVYALGAILFHALTGHTPYPRGSLAAVLLAHANEPVPRVSAIVPTLEAFDVVVATAMDKRPEQRQQSAGALAAAAAAALNAR
jgi:serine/threonine protein kinase